MKPDIFWIKGIEPLRLAIMPRPRSGEWLSDEIAGYIDAGVTDIVYLLESREASELGLDAEQSLCEKHGVNFISYAIPDRGVPKSSEEALQLAAHLSAKLKAGAAIAIHCRAGIGRSGIVGVCVLAPVGIPTKQAFSMLSAARRITVPDTPAQEEWVYKHARGEFGAVQQSAVRDDFAAREF